MILDTNMKKLLIAILIIGGLTSVAHAGFWNEFDKFFGFVPKVNKEIKLGATFLFPSGGGTGTSTNPSYGQMLVGNSGGTYTLTATSSLGITEISPDWLKQTNYGVLNLTASTTIPYWAKDAFYASSTSVFQGLVLSAMLPLLKYRLHPVLILARSLRELGTEQL